MIYHTPSVDSMEYRHWTTRHDFADPLQPYEHGFLITLRDFLPPDERLHWQLVCDMYEARDYPGWFKQLTGEKNDY